MVDYSKLCGWSPNPAGVERWLTDPTNKTPLFADHGKHLIRTDIKDTLLYPPLLKLHPKWKRGAQGIGDCVSWGYEIAVTMLMAIEIVLKGELEGWEGEAATEAIYGGSRVEAEGRTSGGWRDGSYGGAASKWVRNFGILLRKDYSKETGNPEHNLLTYSANKASQWGNYGCGGSKDKGVLDAIAKKHPVRSTALTKTFEEACAAIMNGYPVPVCSGQGFTRNTRDKDGFCVASGRWSHCMCFIGCRGGSRPGLLCMNSWGKSVSGPVWPEDMPESVAACSWWVDADTCNSMLRGNDSFALSNFDGFEPQLLPDWGFSTWKDLLG
jgi:hypothetical protein